MRSILKTPITVPSGMATLDELDIGDGVALAVEKAEVGNREEDVVELSFVSVVHISPSTITYV